MYEIADVRRLHLEITTFCNLRCPQCPRNLSGGSVNPNLPLKELRIADIKRMFPPVFIQQLRMMYICGNYGDAVVARDTLAVFQYFRNANPPMHLTLHTNGSGRDPDWWSDLARTVDRCVFAIDGLEDTNPIYRRGSSWNTIMRAATAFISAGGRAEWTFIAFRHNEHQIDEAERLSRDMGFARFKVKKTARFLSQGRLNDRFPVLDANGHIEYYLSPPVAEGLCNIAAAKLISTVRTSSDYDDYLGSTEIRCKATQDKMIYVSAEGLVFPCCWLGLLYRRPGDQGAEQFHRLLDRLPGGANDINVGVHEIGKIVAGRLFQELIPGGWQPNSSSRIRTCARACGACDLGAIPFES